VQFEWDENKAASNLIKHGISFEEACTVFYDDFSRTISDPFSTSHEQRYLTLGLSVTLKVLLVVHVERYQDKIRIISAREATNAERKKYEQYR
jgi:uncharacterized DUF497 family protein